MSLERFCKHCLNKTIGVAQIQPVSFAARQLQTKRNVPLYR